MSKHVEVLEQDIRNAVVLSKLIAEARFDIKGDALPLAASSLIWLSQLIERLKTAQTLQSLPQPESTPKVKKKGENH